jgi:hypothetical protein
MYTDMKQKIDVDNKGQQYIRSRTTYSNAQVVAVTCHIVKSVCEPLWRVQSESDPQRYYKVVYVNKELTCDCPAYIHGLTVPCKHILATCLMEVS